jgi:uncharacterized protein (DUF927 family)|nr:MAG TPA: active helicase ring shaped helicase [Caudoviricetes sp.]
MTAEDVYSDAVLDEVFSDEDEIHKSRVLLTLEDRAAELGVKTKFGKMVTAYKKMERQLQQAARSKPVSSLDNWTNFSGPYDNMFCGSWIAREDGIYVQNTGTMDVVACYHPILPIERLKNLETGEEQLKIAFKRNGRWEEIIVPKTLVTSANKIVALSGRGIAVTSENARLLVRYLSDVENANSESIAVQYSSSKLGWIKGDFIPYDTDIIFDGDSRFKQIFESIQEHGSRDRWYDHVRELRASGRIEIKFMLAASFASVLLSILGGLPFFVDLWGETEGGKTVSLMLACSVWANPDESSYIGDFKSTDVALEARADVLNNLPMMLDDTSKTSARIRDNFEGVVYDLCSGKGKSRSDKEIGIRRENRWRNVILTNGERPLMSYVSQGGAINRILELECGERVYQNPQLTADILKKHYGFAGKDFVEVVKKLGHDAIREIQADIQKQLQDDEKMQKQSISLSIVLTADRIVTDYLFQDGQYIPLEDAKKVLINREELSENERAYDFILSEVEVNINKFKPDSFTGDYKGEVWGCIEKGYAIILNNAFARICEKGNFSGKSFLSWAARNGLVAQQGGKNYKNKKFYGKAIRCVWLKMPEDDFEEVSEDEELPFK